MAAKWRDGLSKNVPPYGKTHLMAAAGTVPFYERFGFETRREEEPGMQRAGRRNAALRSRIAG